MEKEAQHAERTPPPPPHRAVVLALAVMALGLGGCSTHPPEKKQGQILAEALAKTPNPTQARELVTVTIPTHGALADQLAVPTPLSWQHC